MPVSTKPLLKKLADGFKNWFAKTGATPPRRLDVMILEERILYSATAMPLPDASGIDPSTIDIDAIEAALQAALTEGVDTAALQAAAADATQSALGNSSSDVAASSLTTAVATETESSGLEVDSAPSDLDTIDSAIDTIDELISAMDAQIAEPVVSHVHSPAVANSAASVHEVVFVQSNLLDVSGLIDDIETEAGLRGYIVDVFVLDRLSDGYAQIDDVLAQYDDLNAIHFVSHGTDGMIQLGGSWLTASNVDQHFDDLQKWGMSLNDSGDILIYGCDVAQGVNGQTLIEAIADATHADVAASVDSTGTATRGGNWTLEMQVGQIETLNALSIEEQESYGGLLATYTVTNTANSGAGSLRQAIINANNNAGADTIVFSIGSGVQTITLTSLLPSITGQVTIDGTTQSGYSGAPLIVITGGGTVSDGFQLYTGSDNSIIKGLVIRSFTQDGIDIASSNGNTIVGNYIGIAQSGLSSSGNQQGVNIWAASNNIIGGSTAAERNIISGNSSTGVWIGGGGTGNQVRGNYIGTNYLGTGSLQNGDTGVYIDSANNTVGGTTSGYGNVISGNTSAYGLQLTSLATGSVVQGNTIGLTANGSSALANGAGMRVYASNITIGGTSAAARNLISGNFADGLIIYGSGNTVQGNYIGMDTTGLVKIANGNYGIDITPTATDTMIGGSVAGARNIISGNGNAGILFEAGSSGSVLGNYLGVDATGATSIAGNGAAVFIATSNVKLGGVNAGEGNIISGSNTDGVIITGSVSGNSILGNSIFGNAGLAIDLADNGVSINDYLDSDSGGNDLLNTPVLKSAMTSGGNTTITGKMSGLANTTFRVEFFSNLYGAADANGYGEGKTYLGSTSVTTDAAGNGTFSQLLTNTILSTGSTVTATATVDLGGGSYGSSSEFAGNILANHSNLMVTGTYVGNGADSRVISALGFRPEAVYISRSGNVNPVLRTSSMTGDNTKVLGSATALGSNMIQWLTNDGFEVGTDLSVNGNGTTYNFIAWGSGDQIDAGSYTGTGSAQTINGAGFTPDFSYVIGSGATQSIYRTNQSTNSYDWLAGAPITTAITAYAANGITLGTDATVNTASAVYHYVNWNESAGYLDLGTYTGNGVDSRNITGLGLSPEFMSIRAVSGAVFAASKSESSGYATDTTDYGLPNQIQNLGTDGFQVGFDSMVNSNGTAYLYFAFGQNSAPLFVDTTSDTSDGTTTSMTALRANRGADGVISLREAIAAANASHNGTVIDEINFALSGSGVRTITIGTTGLANITDAVKIDAWTQSGYSSTPVIELNGGNTGTTKDGFNLASGSSGSTIRGFIINRFTGDGIEINSSNNNVIEGNWIGLSNTGTSASANSLRGLYAINSTGLTIGGTSTASRNVISGNTQQGMYFDNVDNSFVYGNYIGTNAAGSADVSGTTANTAQSGFILLNGSSGNQIGNISLSGARNVISGNNHYGAEIQGATSQNNIVSGNYIGTDVTGLSAIGNTNGGFSFWGSGSGNRLTNNIVSGNGGLGILVGSAASGSWIQGNYVGLGMDGSTSVGNAGFGVYVTGASTNTLIGTNGDGSNDAAEGNVISSNAAGIVLDASGTSNTLIYANYIGTDWTGLLARGNSGDGINISSGATSNYVGGTGVRRNVIAANGQDGVQIDGEATDGNFIQNNFIGVGADGSTVLGNGGDGIYISGGADNTTIGGNGLGNVIMGNRYVGIEIDGASTGTVITGNYIGINVAGTTVSGNGQNGILLENSAANTTIGGTGTGLANVVTGNGWGTQWTAGISITSTAGAGNSIIANSIYGNVGLGIDLGTTGVTANDNLDGDTGANNLQNTPVITTATTNGTTVTISGSLNTVASTAGILIHFYATPSNGNINTRQARRYLGSTTVSTNASGNATFSNVALSSAVSAGEVVTATTTLSSSTSEISQGVIATLSSGNSTPTTSQLVATNGGGISLNMDGGNNAYLQADNGGTIFNGLTAMTIEFQFTGQTIANGGVSTLLSYSTPTNSNALTLLAYKSPDGLTETIGMDLDGAFFSANVDLDTIFDGQRHALAVAWSNTAGAWQIYSDGVLLASGTGAATGQSMDGGGNLVIGHDQDAGSNSYQFTTYSGFKGTLHDLRIFNDVRTAAEIAASYQSDLPRTEGGLIANWKFDELSEAGVMTGEVSGNNLTVRNVSGSGFTTSTPILTMQLSENSVTGTRVGEVHGIDIEREARIASLLAADSSLRYSAETNQFYKVLSSTGTWSAAQSGAMATTLNTVAGQLATITSVTENSLVTSMLTNTAWLGGSDVLNEGAWRWYSGSSAGNQFWQGVTTGYAVNGSYTNFQASEPNDWSGNEDYLEINTAGQWNDSSSTATQGSYVVEWNADDVLDATNALTYTITSQTVSGAFSINSDSGVITVADGTELDFETNATHTVTVRISDGTNTVDKNFTVTLNDLSETNAVPTDLSSGINLNTDGGNNAYLMTTNGGTLFGGMTALTLEVSYTMLNNASSESPFVSYAVPAGSDNEVYLRVTPGGTLSLAINGTVSSTTSAYSQLVDGKQHSIAVSWDNTNGDVLFYIDGQFVQMNTGVKAGTTIAAAGTLVLGQDQDAPNANFNTAQRFSGTLHEVRVWDRAISGEQISQNYQQKLGDTPTGLVANWRMTGFNGSNQVVDSVGGVNLSVANVTGGGWVASTPTATLSVNENATVGTVVGNVVATDLNNTRDVVLDGLFREGTNPGTFATYTTGQTIGNWTVQSGDVDLAGSVWQSSPLGGRSIDLNGNNPGAISQVLSTTAGRQYQVIFNASGNFSSGEVNKDFRVSAGGTSQDFSLIQPTGWSTSNMLFSGRSMTFTADSSSTTLAFQSVDAGTTGAVIADVRVIEIPAAVQKILSSDSTLSYDAATGKFYRTVNSNVTWAAAQSAAVASSLNGVSGELVTIGSRYENDLVWSLARGMNKDIWLGASDTVTEGTWRWYNGSNASTTFWVGTGAGTLQSGQYANWRSGQPDDFNGIEEFAQMFVSDGAWNDWTASASIAYIVEWDASEVLSNYTYTITSDPTSAFSINSNTGEITVSNATPLTEIATDPTITVQVTDSFGNTYSEAMIIAVNRVNDNTPVITSNGAGATASISIAENVIAVTTVTATDADLPTPTLGYSIVGGADSSKFTINGSTGVLTFLSAPDFETPTDSGKDNVYDVVVRASDGTNFDDQSIAVTVTAVNEAPTAMAVGSSTNLVTNGTMEAGNGAYVAGVAPTGWTATGESGGLLAASRASEGSGLFAFNGNGSTTGGQLSQTINTVAGQTYTLVFDMAGHGPTSNLTNQYPAGGGHLGRIDRVVSDRYPTSLPQRWVRERARAMTPIDIRLLRLGRQPCCALPISRRTFKPLRPTLIWIMSECGTVHCPSLKTQPTELQWVTWLESILKEPLG